MGTYFRINLPSQHSLLFFFFLRWTSRWSQMNSVLKVPIFFFFVGFESYPGWLVLWTYVHFLSPHNTFMAAVEIRFIEWKISSKHHHALHWRMFLMRRKVISRGRILLLSWLVIGVVDDFRCFFPVTSVRFRSNAELSVFLDLLFYFVFVCLFCSLWKISPCNNEKEQKLQSGLYEVVYAD